MEILYRGLNVADLRGDTVADLLVNIEADLEVTDAGRTIYAEAAFPVAELARELSHWVRTGLPTPFRFASLSFEEDGAITISKREERWVVSSVFSKVSSEPVNRTELETAIRDFVDRVKEEVAALGLDPNLFIE